MLQFGRMAADSAARRVQFLTGVLAATGRFGGVRFLARSADGKVVSIGDVSIPIRTPKNPELVPSKYLPEKVPQTLLKHLRWIMQKDGLGQDVFLIGAPGPLRRSVAMMYLEMTQREAEYVSLSRDTTETDLKQRREIRGGSAFHIDQCAVRAATEGRVLVLEGIEKAERNVLPVLNNLLENREMQLDDGRFLMAASRYDKLLQDHDQSELDKWKLVRVDENFRVIALGLPVPRYRGNPLDPPLRSRFQARNVNALPFKDHLEVLNSFSGRISPEKVTQLLSLASTLKSDEANSLGLPDFPLDNVRAIVQILNSVPSSVMLRLVDMLYPHTVMLGKEGQSAVKDALKSFDLLDEGAPLADQVMEVRRSEGRAAVQLKAGDQLHMIDVAAGTMDQVAPSQKFVATPLHDQLLNDMMATHLVKDCCIVGPRGCGKSVLARQFADLLGYHLEPIMLYQDMTSRDLLQQRMTLPNGDTAWRHAPLITAAINGSLAVLDGVHRVNTGTFAVLHRLIHDRELTLFDGTRLLRQDRYDAIRQEQELTEQEMTERSILPIHPSFRMVALAEPPVVGSSTGQWMTSELLTMFLYHNMPSLSHKEESHVLRSLVPNMPNIDKILHITHILRDSGDTNMKSVAASLSTRQLLRMTRRLALYPQENLYDSIQKACLARFLPRLARTALEEELEALDIRRSLPPASVEGIDHALSCGIENGELRIGNTTVPVHVTDKQMKVPDVLFYENAQHLSVMEDMLKDYLLGEHLLLVGNQGVGKNKIIDRFLFLLNRPREYLQLHRDTTVQTLTLQPTVVDGVILYEDSPLVRAVKLGHILVVDEADKAPTNVTCILKTLVESGEMHLADGRRIVSAHSLIPASPTVVVAHPEFRMFVLANRPGFPFLGNDFFGAMGDIFSCHAIDNPDTDSEMSMLRQYGPDVPEDILRKLVLSFGELRDMADQGLITYPYSTREVVNMVRHLQRYPGEGLTTVVENVFDFDQYNKELKETVVGTLHKHGIPIGANPANVHIAKELPLPRLELVGEWQVNAHLDAAPLSVEDRHLNVKGPVRMNMDQYKMDKTETRSLFFTEQEAFWTLPLHETSAIVDVAVTKGEHRRPMTASPDIIHVATANPISLYSMNTRKQNLTCIDLYDIFPSSSLRNISYRPRIHLAPLGFPLDNTIVLHEEVTNIILSINWETGELSRLDTSTLIEAAASKIQRSFRSTQGAFRMVSTFCHESDGVLLFFKERAETIEVMNMLEGRCHVVRLPIKIASVHMASRHHWLVSESDTNKKWIIESSPDAPQRYMCRAVQETAGGEEDIDVLGEVQVVAPSPLHDSQLSAVLGQTITSPHRMMAPPDCYAAVAVGFPDLGSVEVYSAPRTNTDERNSHEMLNRMWRDDHVRLRARDPVVYLPVSGQLVRALPAYKVPNEVYPEGVRPKNLSGYLEISDVVNKQLRYIPVPGISSRNVYSQWYDSSADVNLVIAETSNDGLVTVDGGGSVRLWETALYNLDKSLGQWRDLIGQGADGKPLQITIDREDDVGRVPDMPKHGMVDPTGAPHVGGSQWAGGTGGTNTAGLGGMGGPYRLDGGGDVTQVSEAEKANVPPEVLAAAREMAQKAFRERLKQIKMSEYDGDLYERYAEQVRPQIKSLRVILDSLQAKGKEREWLSHQTHGDLDDAKLIEGLAGEKAIYKRRGEKEPELGTPQQKPKYVKLLCDVSGSMYRFNGYDGRLEREMESMLMVMEALDSYEHKVKYDIIGHSGEGYKFDIVKAEKPPKNNKDRLDAIKTLHAHSQFCVSGDHTLEATEHAIKVITEDEADEYFVIVLSDANIDRYGIRPKRFAEVLTADEDVNAYVIFIGSLGDQASRMIKQMPSGRAFLCMDTKTLPQILQQIFTSTMLS